MSDNVGYTPGAGSTVAADDIGGVLHQRVKVVLGADGVSEGDVGSTNPLPVSLPATATTAARQDTGNTSLASIDGKIPALGQALAASSVPVILPAATITALTPPAAITGFALESGHLATIDTSTAKIPAQGQALAAGSMPVVLTAIQQAALTPPAAITGFALESGGNLATLAARTPAIGAATTANSSPVNIASDQTVAVSNASLTSIAAAIKAEDAASVDGDSGIQSLGVRQDIPTTDTSLTGDYTPFKTDNKGRVWIASDLLDATLRSLNDTQMAILTEMRVMNHLLQNGLNVRDDLDDLRQDGYFNASLQ